MRRVGMIVVAGAASIVALVLCITEAGTVPGALSNWQALVLGVVQGLTEFLPISSSGHLIIVPWLFGWTFLEQNDEFNQTFDVALHVGTLIAVVAYFRHELRALARSFMTSLRRRRVESADERIAWYVVIATVPAVVIGAAGEGFIANRLGEPWQIAINLAFFGLLLWWADRTPPRRDMSELRGGTALAIGVAQSLALMPGVSRSGITITAGRFAGLDRDSAARFSFYLLVPVTFGAVLFKGVTDVLLGDLPAGWTGPFIVGIIAAAVGGFAAIAALLGYVRSHNYTIFVIFRLVVAALILLLIATGAREATF